MEKMDFWRLCDEFSVVQAALLIIGIDPNELPYVMDWAQHEWPDNFSAALAALTHAILGGRLPATIRRKAWERGWDEEPGKGENLTREVDIFSDQNEFSNEAYSPKRRGVIYRAEPDWTLTTILVDDLRSWLQGRGFKTGFFFLKLITLQISLMKVMRITLPNWQLLSGLGRLSRPIQN